MTDIVEKLTIWPAADGADALAGHFVEALMQEAAAEITKLRAERDAANDHLVEALTVISEQYENGHVNHVDFRVHAKMTADAALEAYRAVSIIATEGDNG